MVRMFVRIFAFLCFVGAISCLITDGARTLADSHWTLSSFQEIFFAYFPLQYFSAIASLESRCPAPLLPVVQFLMQAPAGMTLFAIGAFLFHATSEPNRLSP